MSNHKLINIQDFFFGINCFFAVLHKKYCSGCLVASVGCVSVTNDGAIYVDTNLEVYLEYFWILEGLEICYFSYRKMAGIYHKWLSLGWKCMKLEPMSLFWCQRGLCIVCRLAWYGFCLSKVWCCNILHEVKKEEEQVCSTFPKAQWNCKFYSAPSPFL